MLTTRKICFKSRKWGSNAASYKIFWGRSGRPTANSLCVCVSVRIGEGVGRSVVGGRWAAGHSIYRSFQSSGTFVAYWFTNFNHFITGGCFGLCGQRERATKACVDHKNDDEGGGEYSNDGWLAWRNCLSEEKKIRPWAFIQTQKREGNPQSVCINLALSTKQLPCICTYLKTYHFPYHFVHN